MQRRHFLKSISSGLLLGGASTAAFTASGATNPRPASDRLDSLDGLLEPIRKEHRLPALAAAVVRNGKTVASGATGFRREGGKEKVTLADKFHIGSCTKPMTATLAAKMVEEEKLGWSTTVEEIFPELAAKLHASFRKVTLEQLLSHRSGLPTELQKDGLWGRIWGQSGPPREHRLFLLRETMKQKPESEPGTKFQYSNAGFAVAGAMLEKIANQSWELLITERVFRPLGMHETGFGAPGSAKLVDQPWGHTGAVGNRQPVPPGPRADNPPGIAPGGAVHCPVGDFARFIALHLTGEKEDTPLLKRASVRKLHQPVAGQDYGLGWYVARREWAGGTALNHFGSNTMNFAVMWLAPRRQFGVVVMSNCAGKEAEKGADLTASSLIQKFT